MKYLACALLLLAALPVTACSGAPDYPSYGNGVLANGTFSYLCVTEADAWCQGTQNNMLLPTGIAVGTRFRLAFAEAPGEMPAAVTLLGNQQLDLAVDGTFTARDAGWAAVFAQNDDHMIEDYLNIHVEVPATIAILGVSAATTLQPDETRSVRAQPRDGSGATLGGSGAYDWETSDPQVIAIDVSDQDRARGSATLRAVGRGTARVRVVLGPATSIVDILVGGQ